MHCLVCQLLRNCGLEMEKSWKTNKDIESWNEDVGRWNTNKDVWAKQLMLVKKQF